MVSAWRDTANLAWRARRRDAASVGLARAMLLSSSTTRHASTELETVMTLRTQARRLCTLIFALSALAACDDTDAADPPVEVVVDMGLARDAATDDAMSADASVDDPPDGAVADARAEPEPDMGEEPPTGQGVCADDDETTVRPAGWTAASHCKGEPPDYDLLFPDDRVHRFDLTITADDYQAMLDNLDDLYGGGGQQGGSLDGGENPIYVPMQLAFNGRTWTDVGMRFKGNSSLQSAYRQGVRKMSFRLKFDEYEDENPLIDNQRFHGFKKMTFSNGFSDPSLIRDKLGADIFRDSGVPAARGAFARVYIDVGEGPVYFGLYTMIEDPSDEMLGVQFDDDGGNLYKPEGDGATWSSQDVDVIERDFEKKTREDDADWSDVIDAIDALHADRADAAVWRAGLEAHVDVQAFLRALAVNQVMVNWDSYGYMNHNYYVYGDPSQDGRLVWFPWDLNESMLVRGRRGSDPTDVLMRDVGEGWPLVRYLLDDDVYFTDYLAFVQQALDGGFGEAQVVARAQAYHDLIAPYVVGDDGEQAPYSNLRDQSEFEESLVGRAGLLTHIQGRHQTVADVLSDR